METWPRYASLNAEGGTTLKMGNTMEYAKNAPNELSASYSSIRFVIPYFGSWPFWMPFFLKSCAANSTVDWLIYTDCEQPDNPPPNVVFRKISYSDYCSLVSERLGFSFNPPSPYKLCDLKPALGFVHADDLIGYDFWAFGDIDLIYGALRKYFTEARLQGKYLLSTHKRRVSGHLCIIRNDETMRAAFQKIPNWKKRLADHEHLWPDGKKTIPQYWEWRDGRLTNSDMPHVEFPYFHFMAWKKTGWDNKKITNLICPENLAEKKCWHVSFNGWRQVKR